MTKSQMRQHIQRTLSEYFDGYVLVGRVAGSDQIVIAAIGSDDRGNAMIKIGANGVLQCPEFNGVSTTIPEKV